MEADTITVVLPKGQCPCHNSFAVRVRAASLLVQNGTIPWNSPTKIEEESVGKFKLYTEVGEFEVDLEGFGFSPTGTSTVYRFKVFAVEARSRTLN